METSLRLDDAERGRRLPFPSREIRDVLGTAAVGDGAIRQLAHHAPGRGVVDVLIGRQACAQTGDEPEVLEEVHAAVSARGLLDLLGFPERVLELLVEL